MICSGIISYLGAFPIDYRDEAIQNWMRILKEQHIKYDQHFKFSEILSDPITIGGWTDRCKLPNDDFSIDNAIIMKQS